MRISSGTARRPSYFDANSKLQELVEAEFDIILQNPPHGERTQKPVATGRATKEGSEVDEQPLPDSLALPFAPEEESFIASSIAFLRGRANADLLLEELWSATITDGTAQTAPDRPAPVAEKPSAETPDRENSGDGKDV